jgi:hypothetical protein
MKAAVLRRHSFAILTAIPALALVTFTAILLVRVLSLPLTGNTAVPALVAAITLPGVIATAVVSLIGYLLRQSIDLRTARLGEQAAEAASVEQQRLRMESAMETVKLLATQDGKAAPPVQVSAALIVLSKLGEIDLALDLAAEMWPRNQVTSSAAVALCDAAITSGNRMLQRAAAVLILNNWRRLMSDHGQAQWPACLLHGWPSSLDAEARQIITRALVAWVDENPGEDFRARLIEAAEGT